MKKSFNFLKFIYVNHLERNEKVLVFLFAALVFFLGLWLGNLRG